ncbi:probable tubulin polyglutamylase TTLL9 isoform X6 [Excalfactoria chinensis]|uniref:probable tubulin polyglutamylase TTLL9 isoform X6 n=1 Tax=Excalfactoria chinensis TaxID=46218 RepID=UPI003B3A2259
MAELAVSTARPSLRCAGPAARLSSPLLLSSLPAGRRSPRHAENKAAPGGAWRGRAGPRCRCYPRWGRPASPPAAPRPPSRPLQVRPLRARPGRAALPARLAAGEELSRKNYLVKNLKRFRKQLEREAGKLEAARCDFFPKTFELPSEYHLFVEEFRKKPGTTWIMKPVGRSQGKGIFLFRKLKDIFDWKMDGGRTNEQKDETQIETYVVQRYIENPYLIGGRKFDLRVYILVTSYSPLKAWLYRDGFARFSSMRFTLNSIDDHYVHLTNVAVQKTAPDYDPEKGCKWMIQQLRQYLTAKHGTGLMEVLFADMDNIFIKSLQSVQKVIISDKRCFELYGYDILIDQDLKPWLLEVNASPSLAASSQEDYELKCHLLEDTLHVVDMEGRLTGKEKRVGGFDLIWNDGPVSRGGNLGALVNGNFVANTHLGMYSPSAGVVPCSHPFLNTRRAHPFHSRT